jgi:hypothetical protein
MNIFDLREIVARFAIFSVAQRFSQDERKSLGGCIA